MGAPSDAIKKTRAKYYRKNKDRILAKNKAYYVANREKRNAYFRSRSRLVKLRKYGLSLDQFKNMVREQEGRCAICRKPFKNSSDIHVDHCHQTGAVRGLLCFLCNQGIGKFKDDVRLLELAASYLLRKGGR